jgi:homoserine kinase
VQVRAGTLPVGIGNGMIASMRISHSRSIKPDLFATPADECSASLAKPLPTFNSATLSARYVLPRNLAETIKHLEDRELERLLTVALHEQKRREMKLSKSDNNPPGQRAEAVVVPMTISKINAVRAAFNAGVTPSRIARQFGLSQADVRKALTSKPLK